VLPFDFYKIYSRKQTNAETLATVLFNPIRQHFVSFTHFNNSFGKLISLSKSNPSHNRNLDSNLRGYMWLIVCFLYFKYFSAEIVVMYILICNEYNNVYRIIAIVSLVLSVSIFKLFITPSPFVIDILKRTKNGSLRNA